MAERPERIDKEVDAHLTTKPNSFGAAIELLMTIPGTSELCATRFLPSCGRIWNIRSTLFAWNEKSDGLLTEYDSNSHGRR